MITKPNLLLSKVLKCKYFPNSSFLQVTSKQKDYWLWKSWVEAKQLIAEGCSWQVGNGLSIRVWDDRWLGEEEGKKIRFSMPEGCIVHRVMDLLHQDRTSWNEALLHTLFSDKDVQPIKRIPVSSLGFTGKLIWHLLYNGQFSVRSNYKLAKDMQRYKAGDIGSNVRRE